MVGSAAFVADGRQAVVLGLTEQLVGRRAFGATGFRYCGNLLPPRLPSDERVALLRQVREIVAHLTVTFGLRGLNGLDFVWHAERVWTLEVNPRPTASMELMDSAYNLRVFDAHVRAFEDRLPDFDLERAMIAAPAAGKAILYAAQDVVLGDTGDWATRGLRDIPHPGERIRKGHPVCTILTTGDTPTACLRKLRARAAELRAGIGEQ
jgi:predicted ATP-grasp superfamily ATP-dependent carboligase